MTLKAKLVVLFVALLPLHAPQPNWDLKRVKARHSDGTPCGQGSEVAFVAGRGEVVSVSRSIHDGEGGLCCARDPYLVLDAEKAGLQLNCCLCDLPPTPYMLMSRLLCCVLQHGRADCRCGVGGPWLVVAAPRDCGRGAGLRPRLALGRVGGGLESLRHDP